METNYFTNKIWHVCGLVLILFSSMSCFAQSDTIFLSKSWLKCKRHKASYYRLVFPNEGGYLVKDYYMNGNPEMIAECKNVKIGNFVKNGKCVYYNKKGIKTEAGTYDYNKPNGIWTTWKNKGRDSLVVNYTPDTLIYGGWEKQNQSSLFVLNVNYRARLNKGVLSSGKGLGIELGLNLGYFISQKFLLAPFLGWEMKDIFWNTGYSSTYVNDFNAGFSAQSLTGNDSSLSIGMKRLFNNGTSFHDVNQYFGLMFRLPYSWAPVCKIYIGVASQELKTSLYTINMQPYVSSDKSYDHDYIGVYRKLKWGAEIFLFSGYNRLAHSELPLAERKGLRRLTNILALSVYMQCLDTYHSTFSFSDGYHYVSVSFDRVMSQAFLNKYKTEYVVGVRISYGLF